MRLGYIRVSSQDQNTARQLDGVTVDRLFTDKLSGKSTDRPALQELLRTVSKGDTVLVHSLDRLARNAEDLLRIVRELNEKGVSVEFVTQNLRFCGGADPMGKLMLTLLGAFAEFERSMIRSRQSEGIAVAKTKGVYAKALTAEEAKELKRRAALPGVDKKALAKRYGISRATLYSYLRAT